MFAYAATSLGIGFLPEWFIEVAPAENSDWLVRVPFGSSWNPGWETFRLFFVIGKLLVLVPTGVPAGSSDWFPGPAGKLLLVRFPTLSLRGKFLLVRPIFIDGHIFYDGAR